MNSESELMYPREAFAETAEAAIISALCEDPGRFLPRLKAARITEEFFHTYRRAFSCIRAFIETTGGFHPVAFQQYAETNGDWDRIGGSGVFDLILPGFHGPGGWPVWVRQVSDAYALRAAYDLAERVRECQDNGSAENALKDALERMQAAKGGGTRSVRAEEAVRAFFESFVADRESGDIPGRSTGIAELDAVSGGMKPGELWVVCGQTSRGKSVLMQQIACDVILSGGHAAIFSLEMERAEIVGRMVSCIAGLNYGTITQPRTMTRKDEFRKLMETTERLRNLEFSIDDRAGMTVDDIESECEMIAAEKPLNLIVVDYLQLVENERRKGETREQEVARVSRKLKQLAKKQKCPVLSASQLNDEGKVRESRAIAQDASALLFIADEGVKIGKLRNGRRDDLLPIILNGEKQRFERRQSNRAG